MVKHENDRGPLCYKRRDEKAVGYYSKTNTPNDPKLMYGYGFSLYKLNRLKEAKNILKA